MKRRDLERHLREHGCHEVGGSKHAKWRGPNDEVSALPRHRLKARQVAYVTEILRIVEQQLRGRVMFKGGTSLSKGWGLINRFSEDIDLFVDPQKFEPRPGKNRVNRDPQAAHRSGE